MAFDYSKLEGRIIEKFGSRRAFAKAYGKTENTISRKLNRKTAFSTADIIKMSSKEFLDIPAEHLHEYFFAIKVQEVEQQQN